MPKTTADQIISDKLIFSPGDVDLSHSPLRKDITAETYVLGAFNPGLCRLPNGNLLLMVRVAEALTEPVSDGHVHSIRWDASGNYTLDRWPVSDVDMKDPRKFQISGYAFPVYALTSLSWLLPVELDEAGERILAIHYDKIISPKSVNQEYGIEDPRISQIEERYYMTTCCVSSERHSTILFVSDNGVDYTQMGMVLDHQNKDMLLFEGKAGGRYRALTRPLGECYFASPLSSANHPGPGINLASSPDLLHWKPDEAEFLKARRASASNEKIGGGTPPILADDGWLILYHGVQKSGEVGIYRTFWALLDKDDPSKILRLEDQSALLEANDALVAGIKEQVYIENVVFTTGISSYGDDYIVASGELDLACRITRVSKKQFLLNASF